MTEENFDYSKLAELIAKQMRSAQVDGGEVKHLSDVKLEELEKRMTARLDALEKENRELRAANAELYAAATKKDPQQETSQQQEQTVSSAQVVKDPQQSKAEEEAVKSFEAMYEAATAKLGFRKEQQDGM